MDYTYDMCVDNPTLETIMDKLSRINTGLSDATKKMVDALQESQNFLAGQQFEKARELTVRTVDIASNVSVNINHAVSFLRKMEDHTIQYISCQYKGGA